ncbi:superoxide dismutase [Stenotrophomonas sp. W1S232]|jgi:superoxide dismutase, Fe-Mn family|uniref:Superoxide dismutase n=1 Tax=Stenotrophomonas koreensis TaxID=266128 RepID=A0A0R0BZI5_9GAMM|nr:superoxide dismutase [Stenotrophomonas koreensis]KRG58211.1 superoxide dismutase [Stenotrophomonas koreensis]MBB1116529.1 superoxide dismutase [Stenotrophomonas koreensis]
MAHSLPALKFASDALEPFMDAQTVEIHHGKHHQTYVNNLNALVEGTEYADLSVEDLLRQVSQIPQPLQQGIRNQGGGHANHALFWDVIGPNAGGAPVGALAKAIDEQLGGFDKFKEEFTKAATTQFGSGWAWLSVTTDGKLVIEKTGNQESPLMEGRTPVLTIDVWEHAYYLKYQNRRPEFIAQFYNLIDWNAVEARYQAAIG